MADSSYQRRTSQIIYEAIHQLALIESDLDLAPESLDDLRRAAIAELAGTLDHGGERYV